MADAPTSESDAEHLANEATALFDEVKARAGALHQPGVRDETRDLLGHAIERARRAAAEATAAKTRDRMLLMLARALAMRAEDARYGAGQLSRSAQRAPTEADCEDGWARVAEIVATAQAAAAEARDLADRLEDRRARRAAEATTASAAEAQRVVDERNQAYTFHASPGFSFGEGWYLAAAALLTDLSIQVEPEQSQTAQALRFLTDAGLADRLTPYRPRPRANKALPDIIARGFAADAEAAQAKLRDAFLGAEPLLAPVVRWADEGLHGAPAGPKVLLWLRYARHHADRNTTYAELSAHSAAARAAGLVPVLVGDALRAGDPVPEGAVDWTLFWKQPTFQGEDMRRAQLHLFEHLRRRHALVGQIGVTTAGMDGPALMGLPTMYLTAKPNVRLGKWVGRVPGYEEVVREGDHPGRIRARFEAWASAAGSLGVIP